MEQMTNQIVININDIKSVFGNLDENIRNIEKRLKVQIVNRGEEIVIIGEKSVKAKQVLVKLSNMAGAGEEIREQTVNYLLDSLNEEHFDNIDKLSGQPICLTVSGKPIHPKTMGQKKYLDMIKDNTIVLSVGPAGTGKTYLAMAMAITAFKNNQVNRIILTRPAIEAGEKLGFLPGDLQQKVDPYLRPLYDALYEIMGAETFQKNMEKGSIEVAPLAYMRGRTLDNAFIVLDEAQNTTPEQMKMFLTRIGFGTKAVITGDITQIDLPDGKSSGLKEAVSILSSIEDIGICHLTNRDVVRHPLIQKIIAAYDKHSARQSRIKSQRSENKGFKRFNKYRPE